MSKIKFTIDGKECLGRVRPNDPRSGSGQRHLHPRALPLRRAQAGRKLPDLHGPRRRTLHGRLHPARGRGHGRREHGSRTSRTCGRPSSRCCSSKATICARPAKKAATASSRRWPTATRCSFPASPTSSRSARSSRPGPKLLFEHNRCIQCLRCVRGGQDQGREKRFRPVGRSEKKKIGVDHEPGRQRSRSKRREEGHGSLPGRRHPEKRSRVRRAHRKAEIRQKADRQRHRKQRRAEERRP